MSTYEPAPLPPDPPLRLNGKAHRTLAAAERAVGRLHGQVAVRPVAEDLVTLACAREAVASCRLDGSRLSLADLLWWQLDGARADRLTVSRGEVRVAANLAAALRGIGAAGSVGEPWRRRHLARCHAELYRGVRGRDERPGRLRKHAIWLGPPGSTAATAFYVPPAPEHVAQHLEQLASWAASDAELPPLARIALIAYQLETIHPFVDGNGRLARLVVVELLHGDDAGWPQLLCPSVGQEASWGDRFARLQAVRRQGDWEGWVLAWVQRLREAAETALAGLREADAVLRAHTDLVRRHEPTLVATALPLLHHLAAQPLISVNRVAQVCQRTFANANHLVQRLQRLGLLHEITGRRRHRRYLYTGARELLDR